MPNWGKYTLLGRKYASVKHKPIQSGAYHFDIIICQKPNYYPKGLFNTTYW